MAKKPAASPPPMAITPEIVEAALAFLNSTEYELDPFVVAMNEGQERDRQRRRQEMEAMETAAMAGHGAVGALIRAAYHGDLDSAKAALAAGASPDAADGWGLGALHLACRRGSSEVVKLLLSEGADPEAAGHGGATALMAACEFDQAACVEALLGRGVRLDARRWDAMDGSPDRTVVVHAMESAAGWGAFQPMSFAGQPAAGGDQALAVACQGYGRGSECAQLLLAAEADPNDANRHGITPLMISARAGALEPCVALVEAGADPLARDAEGVDARQLCSHGDPDGSKGLLDAMDAALARREAAQIASASNDPGAAKASPRI